MKRVIAGIAYNTATAELIAVSELRLEWLCDTWVFTASLYRTKTGAWFLVNSNRPENEWWLGKTEWLVSVPDITAAWNWVQRSGTQVLDGRYISADGNFGMYSNIRPSSRYAQPCSPPRICCITITCNA